MGEVFDQRNNLQKPKTQKNNQKPLEKYHKTPKKRYETRQNGHHPVLRDFSTEALSFQAVHHGRLRGIFGPRKVGGFEGFLGCFHKLQQEFRRIVMGFSWIFMDFLGLYQESLGFSVFFCNIFCDLIGFNRFFLDFPG